MSNITRPNSIESETDLLKACFNTNYKANFNNEDAIKIVITETEPAWYAHPHHQKIVTALTEAVQDSGEGAVGWSEVRALVATNSEARTTLRDIATADNKAISEAHARRLHKKVYEAYRSRKMLELMKDIESRAMAGDATTAYSTLVDGIFALGRDRFQSGAHPLSDYIDEALEDVEKRKNSKGIVGLETGIDALDKVAKGMQKKQLILVGARPGNYKSTVAGQVAEKAADDGKRALVCSPEMSAQQYITRLACKNCKLDYDIYNGGEYTAVQEKAIRAAIENLRDKQIIVNESGLQNITSLRQDIIRYKPDILIIDYLQLIDPDSPTGNEYRDVSAASKQINAMKKDFGIPILCCVQLSRKVEERQPPRPMSSDMRGTGTLEQDADAIFMLYHPREYARYDELTGIWTMSMWETDEDSGKNVKRKVEIDPEELEFICTKNRNGRKTDTIAYVPQARMEIVNEKP